MPEQVARVDINPQLCKTLNPDKHKWDKAWIVEPKYDGLRCWIIIDDKGIATPYSRNGKPLWNMGHILKDIQEAGFLDYTLDGEVYTQDWNLSMSIVKRSTQDHPDMGKLRYHVWDSLLGSEFRSTWKDRFGTHQGYSSVSNLERKQNRLWPWATLESKFVQTVPSKLVKSNEELQEAYQEFLAQGYEGAILKDPDGVYQGGRRSPYWLKIKPWTDADLTVIGSYPGEGKHSGRIGGLILEGNVEYKGHNYSVKTEVGTGFTDLEREDYQDMAENGTLIGRIVEIRFQDITVEGSCRFPVYHRLREDRE